MQQNIFSETKSYKIAENIDVAFSVSYVETSIKWIVDIRCMLPVNDSRALIRELWKEDEDVFGNELEPFIGEFFTTDNDSSFRVVSNTFFFPIDRDITDVKKEINKIINDIVNMLSQVYLSNISRIKNEIHDSKQIVLSTHSDNNNSIVILIKRDIGFATLLHKWYLDTTVGIPAIKKGAVVSLIPEFNKIGDANIRQILFPDKLDVEENVLNTEQGLFCLFYSREYFKTSDIEAVNIIKEYVEEENQRIINSLEDIVRDYVRKVQENGIY